jgi:hypothetical protein
VKQALMTQQPPLPPKSERQKHNTTSLAVLLCVYVLSGGTGEDPEAGSDDAAGHLPRKPRYDPCIDGEVEAYFNLPAVSAGRGVVQGGR